MCPRTVSWARLHPGIFENLLNSGDMSFPYIPSYNIFSSQHLIKPASRQFQVTISGGYNSVLQISVMPELSTLTSLPVLTTRTISGGFSMEILLSMYNHIQHQLPSLKCSYVSWTLPSVAFSITPSFCPSNGYSVPRRVQAQNLCPESLHSSGKIQRLNKVC